MTKLLNMIYVIRENKHVLLGMKKRGFGAGKWNGFGGKLEPNETMLEGVIRELKEESGLDVCPDDVRRVGINHYHYDTKDTALEVHVFVCHKFTGQPVETEEMAPQWFTFDKIPIRSMWADDEYWLPHLLNGKFKEKEFKGTFFFRSHEGQGSFEIYKHQLVVD